MYSQECVVPNSVGKGGGGGGGGKKKNEEECDMLHRFLVCPTFPLYTMRTLYTSPWRYNSKTAMEA